MIYNSRERVNIDSFTLKIYGRSLFINVHFKVKRSFYQSIVFKFTIEINYDFLVKSLNF